MIKASTWFSGRKLYFLLMAYNFYFRCEVAGEAIFSETVGSGQSQGMKNAAKVPVMG